MNYVTVNTAAIADPCPDSLCVQFADKRLRSVSTSTINHHLWKIGRSIDLTAIRWPIPWPRQKQISDHK